MLEQKTKYYALRAQKLIKNLNSRGFDAWYCNTGEEALRKALELIPEGAVVGWGSSKTAEQIGLKDAVRRGNYKVIDRDLAKSPEEKLQAEKDSLFADVFLTSANAISLDGQMVNIDGHGNRVAAIVYGPKNVLVVAGMHKVTDDLNSAMLRARTVAAPTNQQRFESHDTPCKSTGICADCKCPDSICNQFLITRYCNPAGRIKFILIGEELGF